MSRSLVALVIGNAKYKKAGKLKNPAHDACDIADALSGCGFTVTQLIDASHKQMDKALDDFKRSLEAQDVGLFFFAGHGVQIAGENYLAAVDTKIGDETEAKHSSLALNKVIDIMEASDTSTDILILDACRNNPWDRAWRNLGSRGLAPVYAPRGTLIAYSTSPGQTACDGVGRNGAYSAALLEHIDTPDCSVEAMFKRVRNTLSAATNQKQISWEHTSLAGEFFFNLGVARRITDYGPAALADELFVLDPAVSSNKAIRELKILTWGRQNPAIDLLTPALLGETDLDTLFVLGRNIYQAACGSSNSAQGFIADFNGRTAGVTDAGRKALLDGMLFEIFFDKAGNVRADPKVGFWNDVFDLQKFSVLKPSFDFIAGCLLTYANRYHAIPGKGHEVVVDVRLGTKDKDAITEVFVGGHQILRLDDDDCEWGDVEDEKLLYRKRSKSQIKDWLSRELVVPERCLKIGYSEPIDNLTFIRFPMGRTCRMKSALPA